MAALSRGRRLKLVASGRNELGGDCRENRLRAHFQVALEELPLDDPLAILDGQANALELDTDWLGRVVITQRDGGLEKTAYALFSDLITIVKSARRRFS